MCSFFERIALQIEEQSEDGTLTESFSPILTELHNRVKTLTLGQSSVFSYMEVLSFFTRKLCLTEVIYCLIHCLRSVLCTLICNDCSRS